MTQTFKDVIGRWPSPDALAAEIGAKPETVRKWRQRNSIPAEWWTRMIEAARERGDTLTADELADMAARSDPPAATPESAEVTV